MARMVTIEGSRVTPSDRLGRGVRAKVQLTGDIRKLVKIGAVIIVDQPLPDDLDGTPEQVAPEPPEAVQAAEPYLSDPPPVDEYVEQPPVPPAAVKPPPRNGATADWQEWVAANVPYADTEGKSRDELIAMWQEFNGE